MVPPAPQSWLCEGRTDTATSQTGSPHQATERSTPSPSLCTQNGTASADADGELADLRFRMNRAELELQSAQRCVAAAPNKDMEMLQQELEETRKELMLTRAAVADVKGQIGQLQERLAAATSCGTSQPVQTPEPGRIAAVTMHGAIPLVTKPSNIVQLSGVSCPGSPSLVARSTSLLSIETATSSNRSGTAGSDVQAPRWFQGAHLLPSSTLPQTARQRHLNITPSMTVPIVTDRMPRKVYTMPPEVVVSRGSFSGRGVRMVETALKSQSPRPAG